MYKFLKYSPFFLIPIYLDAQVEKKIPDDKYGIAYDAVFENMHYNQPFRPQIHYPPITGQIADATGLILYKGTYHIFYMYDEWSRRRKFNKSWGHAVSHDLIFWEQRPQILNTRLDNAPGSGSGIVDWTSVCYLNDDFGGGETIVSDTAFYPKKGKLVVFNSKKLMHGVGRVNGNRYTVIAWWEDTQK